jgi:hypothetical protein
MVPIRLSPSFAVLIHLKYDRRSSFTKNGCLTGNKNLQFTEFDNFLQSLTNHTCRLGKATAKPTNSNQISHHDDQQSPVEFHLQYSSQKGRNVLPAR